MMKSLKQLDLEKLKKNYQIVLLSIGVVLFFSYFFYKNLWFSILLIPVGIRFYKQESKKKEEKERDELSREFREMIMSISANLQAGYAIENALMEARKDMMVMYGEKSQIVQELNVIVKGIHNQISIEDLFVQFGKKSKIQDIEDFGAVFAIAKRTGGDLVNIIKSTADVISKKIEVQNDIKMIISSKMFEQQIMNMVPFGIVFYISFTSKGFFDSMYGNIVGIVVMTGCLLLYLFAYFLSQKMIQIKV